MVDAPLSMTMTGARLMIGLDEVVQWSSSCSFRAAGTDITSSSCRHTVCVVYVYVRRRDTKNIYSRVARYHTNEPHHRKYSSGKKIVQNTVQ
jgi:hypothetical protein